MKTIRMHLFVWLFFAVSFFFPLFAGAADDQNSPSPEPLSMAEAIHIAAEQNPEIKAAQFQVDAVKSNSVKAQSGFYPQLYFAQSFNRTTNPMWAFGTKLNQGVITRADFDPVRLNDPDAINNFASAFALSWSIYEGGQTKLGWEQAKQNLSIASLTLERTRQNVIARTAKAYIRLVLSQKNIMVIHEALESATANLKMIRSRYNSGFVVKSDLLRAMVRIADLEQQQLMANSRFKIGEAMLNAAMGSGDTRPLSPVTSLTIGSEISGTIDNWTDTALNKRPEMENLHLAEDIAGKEIKKSRALHYPDVNLIGNYEINTEDFSDSADNYTIGAVLKINIFSGNRITQETKAAVSMLGRIQQMKKSMKLNIQVQAREAFLKAKSARKRIQVVKIAVDQAEENLRIVKNRYNNGLLTIVGLLDAELARQQAHTDYFKALHDYKTARIELALASGTIDTNFH
ncbi:MAG: TolC family protein [Deltaproteobacteria bacterium]|nr:TolC family protein [Deltaproteobacteria bacterium]